MAKYNKKSPTHSPTKVNKMGEQAYELDAREELVATVMTTFVTDSYYEKESEIVQRLRSAMEKVDSEFIAKLALYARHEGNLRSVSHLLAGELASRASGTPWAKRFYNKIVRRPDDMSEILSYYYQVVRGGDASKMPNAMKKGFRSSLESFDAYQIDKYKMNTRSISLIDLVNYIHPKPNQKNEEAYRRLINDESLDGLYKTKILQKEKTKAGQNAESAEEREKSVEDAIRSTFTENDGDNPIFNTLRNLVSIIEKTPDLVDNVVEAFYNEEKILKSRLLPFRFATAYREVEKLKRGITSTKVRFEDSTSGHDNINKVLKALENAINISCQNIPKLNGRTAVLIDHSGSVRGDGGGLSKVAPFSSVTTAMIGNLFGTMLMHSQDNVFMGLFGDTLMTVDDLQRENGILANAKRTYDMGGDCGGGTEHGLFEFFVHVVKQGIRVDNVFVFSDQVIGSNSWYGFGTEVHGHITGRGNFDNLFREFRKINPLANVVTVDIRQTDGTTVFNKNLNVTQMSGWSTAIFNIMDSFGRGYEDMIKEIEKIEI